MSDENSVIEAAQRLSRETSDRGFSIAGDEDLTHQARAERIDQLWTEADEKMRKHQEDYRAAVAAADRQAERATVRPPSSDPARLASYRSALDRASAAQDADRLAQVLEEAELVGDEDQALAAYTVAIRSGNRAVVGAFLADRPERAAAYDQYAQRTSNSRQRKMVDGMSLTLPGKPRPGDTRRF